METEQRVQYLDPYSYGHQHCVFLVLLMLNRRPRGLLCWVRDFSTSSCLRLRFPNSLTSCPTELYNSSIAHSIIGMACLYRHQAEITVLLFRGHSLSVHQSMSASWAFTLSHFVSQIRLRDFFRLLAIGMCHFLPVHHFGMACLAGSKVKIQH